MPPRRPRRIYYPPQPAPQYAPAAGGPQYYPPQPQYQAQPPARICRAGSPRSYGQQQAYGQPLDDYDTAPATPTRAPISAGQLEQLVAPIALYPDTLVAQILTAATYPAQVGVADQWLRQIFRVQVQTRLPREPAHKQYARSQA